MPRVHEHEELARLDMPIPLPEPMTEEQKYLQFMIFKILNDQYKPQDKDKFGSGFGGMYCR